MAYNAQSLIPPMTEFRLAASRLKMSDGRSMGGSLRSEVPVGWPDAMSRRLPMLDRVGDILGHACLEAMHDENGLNCEE